MKTLSSLLLVWFLLTGAACGPIPVEEFQAMVDAVRPWCDGIIVWSGSRKPFDREAPWVGVIQAELNR